MTHASITNLYFWVEAITLHCYYLFEGFTIIKTRFLTPEKKEIKERYQEDGRELLALARYLYEFKN